MIDSLVSLLLDPSAAVGFAAYPLVTKAFRVVLAVGAALAILDKFTVIFKACRWLFARFVSVARVLKRRASKPSATGPRSVLALSAIVLLVSGCASTETVRVESGSVSRLIEMAKTTRSNDTARINCDAAQRQVVESQKRGECVQPVTSLIGASASVSVVREGEDDNRTKSLESECDNLSFWRLALSECLNRRAESFSFNPFSIYSKGAR